MKKASKSYIWKLYMTIWSSSLLRKSRIFGTYWAEREWLHFKRVKERKWANDRDRNGGSDLTGEIHCESTKQINTNNLICWFVYVNICNRYGIYLMRSNYAFYLTNSTLFFLTHRLHLNEIYAVFFFNGFFSTTFVFFLRSSFFLGVTFSNTKTCFFLLKFCLFNFMCIFDAEMTIARVTI